MIPWNQVNVVDVTAGAHQILFAAKDNLVGIQGFATYIEGFRCRNSKTAALTDCIVNLTFVFAEYVALFIYEITRFRRLSGILFNKGSIISVRYEADILTVRFICIDKALFLGNVTNFFFGVAAKWKQCMRQLILRHGVENIALIFCRIEALFQNKTSCFRILFTTCIVSACDVFTAKFSCFVEKGREFQKTVTVNTRVRCATVQISIGKFVNDAVTEFIMHWEDVIEHSKSCGNASGIFSIRWGAAGTVSRETALWIIIKLQSRTGTVVALLNHQVGCYAGVNSAAHGDDCFFLHIYFSCYLLIHIVYYSMTDTW